MILPETTILEPIPQKHTTTGRQSIQTISTTMHQHLIIQTETIKHTNPYITRSVITQSLKLLFRI